MIVIADSNIFVSALMTPEGVTASVLKEKSKIQFIAPDYLIFEVENHYEKIIAETGKTKKEIVKEFKQLLKGITIIETTKISKQHFAKAYEIVKEIDIDDTPFVALHLHTGHKIWTGDAKLKNPLVKKGYGHFFISTQELKESLYKK